MPESSNSVMERGVMPREQINFPPLLEPTPESPATPAHGIKAWRDASLHVSWHPDSHVQIAVEMDVSYAQLAVDTPTDGEAARTEVFVPPLSRGELNKLIRVLRRARDQAFGADE